MSTDRDDVQYVITEYGIADLFGKTIRERALALIQIAHPDFRAELMAAAKERKYVYADQMLEPHTAYPDDCEWQFTLAGGIPIRVRPARPTDERMVQTFLYGMDEASIRYRFHGRLETLHHQRVQSFVNVDYEGTVTILALRIGEHDEEEEVIGIGQYLLYPASGMAEVAFTTALGYRSRGIATRLLEALIRMARERGIPAMFAMVLRENLPMLQVFKKVGRPLTTAYEGGFHHVTLDIRDAVAAPGGVALPDVEPPG
jgi:GNAT superfamily N-acetyltransferase